MTVAMMLVVKSCCRPTCCDLVWYQGRECKLILQFRSGLYRIQHWRIFNVFSEKLLEGSQKKSRKIDTVMTSNSERTEGRLKSSKPAVDAQV